MAKNQTLIHEKHYTLDRNLKIEQYEPHLKSSVNSVLKEWALPAPLAATIMLLMFNIKL
jgi:hypothetical protein